MWKNFTIFCYLLSYVYYVHGGLLLNIGGCKSPRAFQRKKKVLRHFYEDGKTLERVCMNTCLCFFHLIRRSKQKSLQQ